MALSPLEQAILLTIAYTQQFEFPLTLPEIRQRLIAQLDDTRLPLYTLRGLTSSGLKQAVQKLVKKRRLSSQDGYFFLSGQRRSVTTRQKRLQIAAHKWAEVGMFVAEAEKCPWIQGIFVTGSLAMNNTRSEDDVDYMIVTQPHRLWLTRLWVTWIAWRHGKRRSWHGEEKRSWCFNLWVTQDHLAIFAQQPSLYVAYELLQTKVVLDRGQVNSELHQVNRWAKEFLPAGNWPRSQRQRRIHRFAANLALDLLEKIVFALQWIYMQPHITRERVSLDWAFFHPRDTEANTRRGLDNVI